jgi:hypothetical protein
MKVSEVFISAETVNEEHEGKEIYEDIIWKICMYILAECDLPLLLLVLLSKICQSQWPRALRHELSSPARTLASWVRISHKAWMSVCVYSVFVFYL